MLFAWVPSNSGLNEDWTKGEVRLSLSRQGRQVGSVFDPATALAVEAALPRQQAGPFIM